MNDPSEECVRKFAEALVSGDYDSAHQQLAPWLQKAWSPDALETMVTNRIEDIADEIELERYRWLESYSLRPVERTYAQLKAIPKQITEEIYRDWIGVVLEADPKSGLEAWFQIWCITVEIPGGYRIGYMRPVEAE